MIFVDFNKESLIELGKEWPIFNNKICECRLDKELNIVLCRVHQFLSVFDKDFDFETNGSKIGDSMSSLFKYDSSDW